MRLACQRLLQEYGHLAPPIPLKRLSDRLGIRVVRRATHGNGTLRMTSQGLEIWLSPDKQHWRRGRFTIAHEIAHVLLMTAIQDILPSDHAAIEQLCNLGAAELLMPARAVQDVLVELGFNPAALRAMYDLFLVSYDALLFRIAELLPSSAILRWQRYARTPNEPVALRVKACYPGYHANGRRPWLPQHCTTTKHLFPDTVTEIVRNNTSDTFTRELTMKLDRRQLSCLAVSCLPLHPRTDTRQLPLFGAIRVEDEPTLRDDAILLVGLKSMVLGNHIWGRLAQASS